MSASHISVNSNRVLDQLKLDAIKTAIDILDADTLTANGYSKVLLTSAGGTSVKADTTLTVQQDPEQREGWNCINPVAATKLNLYYFGGATETMTLGGLLSVYFKAFINVNSETSSIPFINIYTKPTGSGDAQPWYHSRVTYAWGNDDVIGIGEECIFYGKALPSTQFNNRKIKLTGVTLEGDGAQDEEILYIVCSTNSIAAQNAVNVTLNLLGFNTASVTRNLVLSTEEITPGDATAANQSTMISHLSSIDTKVATASNQSTQNGILSSIDTKVATASNQSTQNGILSSIDSSLSGTLTVDGSGFTQPISAASLPLPSNASTDTLQLAGNSSLASIDGKITSGNDSTLLTAQQVLTYGEVTSGPGTGELHPLHISAAGDLQVEISGIETAAALNVKKTETENLGSHQNLLANVSWTALTDSSVVDITNMRDCVIVYQDATTSSMESVYIYASPDSGSNYLKIGELYPFAGVSTRDANINLFVGGFDRLKLVNGADSVTSAKATIVGSP
jgi:hypothetical protein